MLGSIYFSSRLGYAATCSDSYSRVQANITIMKIVKRDDKGGITTWKDLECRRLARWAFVRADHEGLTLFTVVLRQTSRSINSFDDW